MLSLSRLHHIKRLPSRHISYFKLLEDYKVNETIPQLTVSKKWGFLPRELPLFDMPAEFKHLDDILKRMPLNLPNGGKGLLAKNQLAQTIHNELPLVDVSKITSTRLLEALMRDYTYAASAYLLEPCDIEFRKSGSYGLGRDHLPKNIAIPLCQIAEKLGVKPFMEYTNYVLTNWKQKDPSKGMDPDNLIIPRRFEGGPDEHWFMAVHLYML